MHKSTGTCSLHCTDHASCLRAFSIYAVCRPVQPKRMPSKNTINKAHLADDRGSLMVAPTGMSLHEDNVPTYDHVSPAGPVPAWPFHHNMQWASPHLHTAGLFSHHQPRAANKAGALNRRTTGAPFSSECSQAMSTAVYE